LCFLVGGWNPAQSWAEDSAADPIRVVVAGDVMLDGGPGHAVVHGENPFAEFESLFRNADISVCNLECVVAENGKQVLKPYTFQAPLCCLPLIKRYFSAVSLANNHSGDFGHEGLAEELRLFDQAGLPYFGGGRNRKQARAPLVLERHGVRVALLAYNDFPPRSFEAGSKTPGIAWLIPDQCVAEIKAARTDHHADIVIPYLHWGEEGKPGPEESQHTVARQLIDAGANAIIGNHPHCTQTVEIYKGRPIIYSLGNFVFDYYPVDPAVFTGWVVRLTFRRPTDVELETFVVELDRIGFPHMNGKR
jgi:poly-gamma-glutamate synthesis protein (capsule biosynthesis protein)